MQVNSGQVAWHNNRLNLNDINASLGKSQFSQIAAALDTNGKAPFKLECKSANLFAGNPGPGFRATLDDVALDTKEMADLG